MNTVDPFIAQKIEADTVEWWSQALGLSGWNDKCKWVELKHFSVFTRHVERMLSGTITRTLDLSNFNTRPRFRSKGYFTAFITNIEGRMQQLAQELVQRPQALFIENVIDERFREFWKRRGYTEVISSEGWPPSYYKVFEKGKQ